MGRIKDHIIDWEEAHPAFPKDFGNGFFDVGDFWLKYNNLKRQGWTEVILDSVGRNSMLEAWLEGNGILDYWGFGENWIFRNSQDAVWFKLKWL